jgi:hypothetical protein
MDALLLLPLRARMAPSPVRLSLHDPRCRPKIAHTTTSGYWRPVTETGLHFILGLGSNPTAFVVSQNIWNGMHSELLRDPLLRLFRLATLASARAVDSISSLPALGKSIATPDAARGSTFFGNLMYRWGITAHDVRRHKKSRKG